MKDYSLLIFDFDNTLFDTRNGIIKMMTAAMERCGLPYEPSMFTRHVGMTMEQAFDEMVGEPSKMEMFREEYMKVSDAGVFRDSEPFPEAVEAVDILHSNGCRLCIASGKMRWKIEELTEREGIRKDFEFIVGLEDITRPKPDPQSLEMCIAKYGMDRADIAYVGDAYNDMQAARNAGVDAVLVDRGDGFTQPGLECDVRISSLLELID
jgi:phosphoglycolate phosphatase